MLLSNFATINVYTVFFERLCAHVSTSRRTYVFMFAACLFFNLFFCAMATGVSKDVYISTPPVYSLATLKRRPSH